MINLGILNVSGTISLSGMYSCQRMGDHLVTSLVLDDQLVCRYDCNGHKRVIPVTDIQQIRWQYRPNIKHPIIAAILTILAIAAFGYLLYHYGLNTGILIFPRGGLVLMPVFFIMYMVWHFMLYRKIPWLIITHKNGQTSQLPLEDIKVQYIELLISRVETALKSPSPC